MVYDLWVVGCCLWCVILRVYGLMFSNGKQYRLKQGLDDRHCWSWRLRDDDDDDDDDDVDVDDDVDDDDDTDLNNDKSEDDDKYNCTQLKTIHTHT